MFTTPIGKTPGKIPDKTPTNKIDPNAIELLFKNLKWRRKCERRRQFSESGFNAAGHVEKRDIGDRRSHLMDAISHIIFPKSNETN